MKLRYFPYKHTKALYLLGGHFCSVPFYLGSRTVLITMVSYSFIKIQCAICGKSLI